MQIAEIAEKKLVNQAQFWVTLALVLTFITDMVRRMVQRRWDNQDRQLEKEEEHFERIERDEAAKQRREEIAAEIKARLELQQLKEITHLDEVSAKVIDKIEFQKDVVIATSEKVATEIKAAEHQEELKEAIDAGAEAAHLAYEIANTINHKLEKMSQAGLLDKHGEEAKKGIQTIEDLHEKRKDNEKPR